MKRINFTFLLFSFCSTLFSQDFKKSCDLDEIFPELFSIERLEFGDRIILARKITLVDSASCYSDLINNNNQHLNYLLTNFIDKSNYDELILLEDSIELKKSFINDLRADSAFVTLLSEFLIRENGFKPDTLKFNQLINIAVKFFNINSITKEGYYSGKVCTGINLLKATEDKRLPQVEAFCFASIFENYISNNYNLQEKFVSAIKSLYKINMGIENEDRLLRAQGALFVLMSNDNDVRESLWNDYQEKSKYLPFVVTPE